MSAAASEDVLHYPNQPDLALAAVLHLLSRFPARQSPALAKAIVDHLRVIGDDVRLAACVRECASSLVDDWRAYLVLSEPLASATSESGVH